MFSSEDEDNHVFLRTTALVAHCAWDTIAPSAYMKTDQQILLWNEHSWKWHSDINPQKDPNGHNLISSPKINI